MNHPRSKYVRFERSSSFRSKKGNLKKIYEKIKTIENWRKTVLFICVVSLAFDPLFFFIPVVDSDRFCFTFDKKLGAAVSVLRTFIDTFYLIHIIFHLITELIAPPSQKYLRGEIVVHSIATRKKPILSYFMVDIVSILPIPQVVVLALIQKQKWAASLVTKEILKWVMFCQYIPRSIRIYPIFKEVTRVSGTVAQRKWTGAALNLFLYLLPSHVFGAFWYLIAIEKRNKCWREVCGETHGCNLTNLYCGRGSGDNRRFLETSCPLIDPGQVTNSTVFNFGMYIDALKSGVVESRDFPRKFFYCFWWGLRNLSALGQNIETSNAVGEIIFAIIICISGLLLFAVLIGNVQKYLQSITIRVDEMEEKKRDTEKWMSYRMLPEYLKERIRRYKDYKWRETRDTEEEGLLRSLSKDIRVEIKSHLYKSLLNRVPLLRELDDGWLLEALCDRLKSVFYLSGSYVVRVGDPIEEMLIVTRGELKCISSSNDSSAYTLKEGDLYGGDLFIDLIDPNSSPRIHTSDSTLMTVTDVEGFILLPDDIKFVNSHFNRFQILDLRSIHRYYSPQWQTWGASFIQAAWRRFKRRKLLKMLERNNQQTQQATQLNLGDAGDSSSSRISQDSSLSVANNSLACYC